MHGGEVVAVAAAGGGGGTPSGMSKTVFVVSAKREKGSRWGIDHVSEMLGRKQEDTPSSPGTCEAVLPFPSRNINPNLHACTCAYVPRSTIIV